MKIDDFDYPLPPELIAQYPPSDRETSRLMVLPLPAGEIEHRTFRDLPDFLRPGDLLVSNNTRVLPARLVGRKMTGGRCEMLLLPPWEPVRGEWQVLLRGAAKLRPGMRITFDQGIEAEIVDVTGGRGKVRFPGQTDLIGLLNRIGHVPLPPYIRREDEPLDRIRYQTVFAERNGSIAAPTAGLHFTPCLLEALREKGIGTATVTLHIGIGTFAPVKVEEVENHSMDPEWAEVSPETARAIARTKESGGRIIAVGTTAAKTLESFGDEEGRVAPGETFSSLFIRPPYRFRVIDGLVTNFHLPRSTLILLVSALTGRGRILDAYREAVRERYRFYSYGDAMLIL
jgi:S-adenosylmethionine:tRNA ribosyltransferase-isomerase